MPNSRFKIVGRNPDGSISIRNGPSCKKRRGGNGLTGFKKNNVSKSKLSGKSKIDENCVVLDLPIRTKSEANCFEHWTIKHKRHKAQQAIVASVLKPIVKNIKLPCKIILTRLAPKTLDKHDNLPMSFKYIVDTCCAIITGNYISGRADDDERISINYDQIVSKEYGINIKIEF